jgi:catechol-2,3-dioxygenase
MTMQPIIKGVGHVGLYAEDLLTLAQFYQAVLGLQIVRLSGPNPAGVRHSIFLRCCAETAHHHLAIFANPAHRFTAFQVASLADLRVLYQQVIDQGLPVRWALNHGISLAFYCADPAGNPIKLYWSTGVAYPQPHGHPIDLTQSEKALRQDVADLVALLKISKGGRKMT